jgi:hypothetical protein
LILKANFHGPRKHKMLRRVGIAVLVAGVTTAAASAGPSPETAKKCIHYSYIAFPYKRPGSVRGTGDRQSYFRDCMAKDGNVPEPPSPDK